MCITVNQIDQACGFLLLNELSVFVYCCKECLSDFKCGSDLEEHILQEHPIIENVFVNDGILEQPKMVLIKVEPEDGIDMNLDKSTVCTMVSEIPSEEIILKSSTNMMQSLKDSDSSSDESIEFKTKANPRKNHSKREKKTNTFYCDMCPADKVSFKSKENVRQHMKRHQKKKIRKQCPICKKMPFNFDKHMRVNHLEASPYKCDFCDAVFKNNCSRIIHMRTHTGERPFLCPICGKSFKSQDTRNKHHKRLHMEKLPHQCHDCDRSFISPSQLQEHIYAFHSDERPYVCEICSNSYSTRKYLRKHKLSHGERTQACKYCEKKFKTGETRRWHERTVHKAI